MSAHSSLKHKGEHFTVMVRFYLLQFVQNQVLVFFSQKGFLRDNTKKTKCQSNKTVII